METMHAKITDYWDERASAIDGTSRALLELAPADRPAALDQIRLNVAAHVSALNDELLLFACLAAADDLYEAACSIDRWDSGIADYLAASAATFWRLFSERGFMLQYVVDNLFSLPMMRPLELFPSWYAAAGIAYLSPQAMAQKMMRRDRGDDAPFGELLPRYDRLARKVIDMTVKKCQEELRSFVLVDADFEEESLRSAFAVRGNPGVVTIFRNQAPGLGTTVQAWYPPPFGSTRITATCRKCGTRCEVNLRGGSFFHLLHCTDCGRDKCISFFQLGDIYDVYIERSRSAHGMLASDHNEADTDAFPGKALTEQEYHQQVEVFAGACPCGGRFSLGAKARCSQCRSTSFMEKDAATGLTTFFD